MTNGHCEDPVWAVADARREMACRYDDEFNLTWIDQGYKNVHGENLLGSPVLHSVAPADRESFIEIVKSVTPGSPRVNRRQRSTIGTGGVRWEEWTHHGVFDSDGSILEYHAVGRDVTTEVVDEERRLAAENRLRRAIVATGLGTWEHSLVTKSDHFDPRSLQILGFPLDTPSEQIAIWTDRVHPDDLERVAALWTKAAGGEAHWDSEYRVKGESGAWIWVHSVAIDRNDDKIIGILADVTDRRWTEDRLRESERRLQFALRAAHEGLWDLDLASGRMELSERSADVLGLGAEWPPDGWLGMVHEEDQAAIDGVMKSLIDGSEQQYAIEHRIRHDDGKVVWVHNRASALERDPSGHAVRLVGLLGDVTDRRRTMLQFQYLAQHDTLTSLLNRAAFWDVVRRVLEERQPAALVLIDLDHFKPVNDDHGHDVGDRLLMEVASRLRNVLRRSDTIARLGGDEFALLCPNFRSGRDERIVTRILATLAEPFSIQGRNISISGSAGIAVATTADTSDQLYARADGALYTAKRAGRNRYVTADAPSSSDPPAD